MATRTTARSKARKRALDVLYAAELRGEPPLVTLEAFVTDGNAPTNPYSETLVRGVVEQRDRIDELLTRHSRGWTLARMPAVDRNVLRLAVYELLAVDDVPSPVALSEAVALVRDLSTDESPPFVNGVLASVADELEAVGDTGTDATPGPDLPDVDEDGPSED
ncbi:transcription antitermination factor NusB [Nocardioides sp. CFH 31398]|uniref:transcription antitermination factor NusB n=1 Tax=Nocardioides sp. CFH 31398 TaxID=2919579 RepID=UPI001F050DF5|nr:transcription antitermination factor NusB [Nocardioides sp. CFH 31398]MCH1867407.1 transcription antitermination factor NusB [Nocardioides sp. CFH 31398]MCH1868596.1 transcription antitermination factor NusB [Nocardioides sp. CFH 31398]